jgi:flagellar L-ring protein precursor FlgH
MKLLNMIATAKSVGLTFRTLKGLVLLVVMTAALQACALAPTDKTSYAPTRPKPEMLPPPTQGAIFQSGQEISLFQDAKARRVGDILTVVLAEQTSASKKADTNTTKKQDIAMPNPTLFGAPLSFNMPGNPQRDLTLETKIAGTRDFAGAGDSSQSNQLNGNITVTVAEVLSNGNLIVRGQKRVTINQGDEFIQFYGIVRPADIASDNTVSSTLVADAKISYIGKGMLDEVNDNGWLARVFNSKWWPF